MSSYIDKCPRPIPIGKQRYAYQCENIAIDAALGECVIRAWPPMRGGKEPYPNEEAGEIDHYNLTLKRFTGNAIELTLLKKMKDGDAEGPWPVDKRNKVAPIIR